MHNYMYICTLCICTLRGRECAEKRIMTSSLTSSGNLASSDRMLSTKTWRKAYEEDGNKVI